MVKGKEVIKIIEDRTGRSGSDLRTRFRWLTQAEVTPKGTAGRDGVGAVDWEAKDVALFLLGLASKDAKDAPDYALKLARFRGTKLSDHPEHGTGTLLGDLTEILRTDIATTRALPVSITLPMDVPPYNGQAEIEWKFEEDDEPVTQKYICLDVTRLGDDDPEWPEDGKPRPEHMHQLPPSPVMSELIRFDGIQIATLGKRLGFTEELIPAEDASE